MRLIGLAVILALSLFAAPLANAQQAGQIPRIGFLRTAAPPESYIEAFRQGLKERGYIEGKNIAFEYRWGGGRTDQLPELAAELVRLKVDVVVVEGTRGPVKKCVNEIRRRPSSRPGSQHALR